MNVNERDTRENEMGLFRLLTYPKVIYPVKNVGRRVFSRRSPFVWQQLAVGEKTRHELKAKSIKGTKGSE